MGNQQRHVRKVSVLDRTTACVQRLTLCQGVGHEAEIENVLPLIRGRRYSLDFSGN